MRWDPQQYSRYSDERGRPFTDLLARVRPGRPPRLVVDLGCGPGDQTATLAERWPTARVVGVDSSPEMVGRAAPRAHARLSFVEADLRDWTPPGPVDVLVTNATLQWVPGHLELLASLVARLAPGGVLALQVPGNHDGPPHALLRRLRREPRWAPLVGPEVAPDLDRAAAVAAPAGYLAALASSGCVADVWETTYLHVLPGEDPVLEWMRGTGARPTLAALADRAPDRVGEFEAEYAALLRRAYPPQEVGTVLPFRRIFAVGTLLAA